MTATLDPGETFVQEDPYLYGLEWEEPGQFFAGRPVVELGETVEPGEPVADPSAVAWALTNGLSGHEGEPGLERELGRLVDSVGGDAIESLVVVHYGHDVPAFLAANAARLPRLRPVFLGFVSTELMEICWIEQGDITPLLEAFPHLERLDVRGSSRPCRMSTWTCPSGSRTTSATWR